MSADENTSRDRGPTSLVRVTGGVHFFHGDAVRVLRSLPHGSIDLLITDPPYESLEKHRAVGTTTRLKHSKSSSNDWFRIFPNLRFQELFEAAYDVLADDRHFYLFCDQETMFVAKPIAEAAGFKFWKPLIWDKEAIGMGYHYRARYECILFFEKGKRKLRNLGIPDILRFKRIVNGYPAEKPSELIEVLIGQSSEPGEVVCDPFMGSGSTGVAALRHGRQFVGADLSLTSLRVAAASLGSQTEVRCLVADATGAGWHGSDQCTAPSAVQRFGQPLAVGPSVTVAAVDAPGALVPQFQSPDPLLPTTALQADLCESPPSDQLDLFGCAADASVKRENAGAGHVAGQE